MLNVDKLTQAELRAIATAAIRFIAAEDECKALGDGSKADNEAHIYSDELIRLCRLAITEAHDGAKKD